MEDVDRARAGAEIGEPVPHGLVGDRGRPAGRLLEAIAAREELTVGEADVEAEIARLARESGRAPQVVRSLLERGNELDGLRLTLREAKTLALLVERAKIEPVGTESVA